MWVPQDNFIETEIFKGILRDQIRPGMETMLTTYVSLRLP